MRGRTVALIATVGLVVAGLAGCGLGRWSMTPSVIRPTSGGEYTATPGAPTSLDGIDSATVETVTIVTEGSSTWRSVVDLQAGQAYHTWADLAIRDSTRPTTTNVVRPLSDAEEADFRAMLDTVGIWTWRDLPTGISPGMHTFVVLSAGTKQVVLGPFMDAPPGWRTFYDAVVALTGE